MNRYEKRKRAIEETIRGEIDKYKAIYKKAEDEDRDPSDEERLDIESHLKAIETLKGEKEEVEANIKTLQNVEDIGRTLGPVDSGPSVTEEPPDRVAKFAQKALGRMFTESDGYKAIQEKGFSGQWSTGPIEFETKAGTLFDGSGGQGAGLIPVPQVAPGVVTTLFQAPRVAPLFAQGVANSNSIRYIVEGTATNSAAGVAEGGAKPASDLALSTKDESIKKIATILTVSDEMLEDVQQVESYINNRLSLFIQLTEDTQLVRGAGTNDLAGIMDSSRSINTNPGGTAGGYLATDTFSMQIFKAMNGCRGSSFLEPDAVIVNPADWQTIRLARDTANQFYGGGPFQGPYGSGENLSATGQVTGAIDSLWGKPVIVTTAINAGTALVGAFKAGAQIWRRSGITVEATNAHASYFTNNLVAIRAEERLGLTVYRPKAFCAQTLAGTAG